MFFIHPSERIVVLNLSINEFILDDDILAWIHSAQHEGCIRWYHRYSATECDVCFYTKDQCLYMKHYFNKFVFPLINPRDQPKAYAETLPAHLENNVLNVVKMIAGSTYKNHTIVSKYLKVCAPRPLIISDWLQVFPNAYDIHRTSVQSKIVVEFKTIADAEEAMRQVHNKPITIWYRGRDAALTVCVGAIPTSSDYLIKSKKVLDENLKLKIVHEDMLAHKVVDWLYK